MTLGGVSVWCADHPLDQPIPVVRLLVVSEPAFKGANAAVLICERVNYQGAQVTMNAASVPLTAFTMFLRPLPPATAWAFRRAPLV